MLIFVWLRAAGVCLSAAYAVAATRKESCYMHAQVLLPFAAGGSFQEWCGLLSGHGGVTMAEPEITAHHLE